MGFVVAQDSTGPLGQVSIALGAGPLGRSFFCRAFISPPHPSSKSVTRVISGSCPKSHTRPSLSTPLPDLALPVGPFPLSAAQAVVRKLFTPGGAVWGLVGCWGQQLSLTCSGGPAVLL